MAMRSWPIIKQAAACRFTDLRETFGEDEQDVIGQKMEVRNQESLLTGHPDATGDKERALFQMVK